LIADGPDGEMAVAFDGTGGGDLAKGRNIANEARDSLTFDNVDCPPTRPPRSQAAYPARRCTGAAPSRGPR
jgi:hypothetical protein